MERFTLANKFYILLLVYQSVANIFNLLLPLFSDRGVDLYGYSLLIISVIGSVVALIAIFTYRPPYHHLTILGTVASIVLGFYNGFFLQFIAIGALILYFHLRHPLLMYRVKPKPKTSRKIVQGRKKKKKSATKTGAEDKIEPTIK